MASSEIEGFDDFISTQLKDTNSQKYLLFNHLNFTDHEKHVSLYQLTERVQMVCTSSSHSMFDINILAVDFRL